MSSNISESVLKGSRKRRKKLSFVRTVKKKYGKGGKHVKGTHLEIDEYQYFIRVLELERQEFDSVEDKRLFVDNVFDQIIGNEVAYSSNQLVSRVLETLLPFASNDVLLRFMEAFGKDLRPICGDAFSSHVLQQLISVAAKHAMEDDMKIENKEECDMSVSCTHKKFCLDWVIKISRFILNNLEEFVWDNYANHITRTVITSLAGVRDVEKNKIGTKQSMVKIEKELIPPQEFVNMLREFASRILLWAQFADFANNYLTSAMLQVLLKTLKLVDKKVMKKIIKHFLNIHFTNEANDVGSLPTIFESNSGAHLLETVIELSNEKLLSKIYTQCFYSRLSKLSQLKTTNFAVQRLINCCKDKTNFEGIMNELLPDINEVLHSKNTGVLLSLSQACERLGTKQGDFIKGLMKALDCFHPEDRQDSFVICVSKMSVFRPDFNTNNFFVHIHGSLILQAMLNFKKPIKVINSLLSTEPTVLTSILCDEKGCHIIDAFVSSVFVGEKSRERLTRHLMGWYVTLATSKHGSRSFEAIWSVAAINHKVQIAAELCSKLTLIISNQYGKIISSKISLESFQHSREDWKLALSRTDCKKKLFSDIIGDVDVK